MSPTGGSYPGGQPLQNPSGYARTSAYGLTSSGINLPASSTSNPLFPQGLLPFPSIGNEGIILLPQTPMEACNAYLQECQAYNQEAFKPYVEAHLQRPTLNATPVQPAPTGRPEQVSMFTTSPDELDPLGSTTVKGSLYAAQQIARARDAVRKGQFDEALDCYQAAKTIDARNTSALVGIPYCYIMTAKFQAGGLAVLRLADQRPEFWQKPPEFNAVFGAPEATIIANLPNMETRLENLIKLYGVGSGKAVSEEVKLVFLSRMFVAWLRGDLDRMKESLREAVRYAPLDASVQELYAQVTGQKAKERITLKTIPSME